MSVFRKKKFQNFVSVHVLFLAGLLVLDPTWSAMAWSLVVTILIILPLQTLIYHHRFNHDYIDFRHPVLEWLGLWFLVVYHYWRFDDARSYHVMHHRHYGTDQDPTAREIQQGRWRFYVGLTDPTAIPRVEYQAGAVTAWFNRYFWTVKTVTYVTLIVVLGLQGFWLAVLLPQFYLYVLMKLHEYVFHSVDRPRNLPWLFPVFFNDAWHIRHHEDDREQDPWRWPWINPQWYFYRCFFRKA